MNREGLYIMVFIILINTCSMYNISTQTQHDVKEIKKVLMGDRR